MPFRRLRIAVLLLIALPANARAAQEDTQLWTTLGASAPVADRLVASGEAIARASDNQGRVYEVQLTGLLGFKLSKQVTLSAGYSHLPEYRASGDFSEERALQQVEWTIGQVAGGRLDSRTLLEERFRGEAHGGTAVRLRERLRFSLPLARGSSTKLVLWHESFIGVTRTSYQLGGWNRMRNFVGLGLPLLPRTSAEVGYLNQYDLNRGKPDQDAHVASVALKVSF